MSAGADDAPRRRQRGARDRALELADVARPVIRDQQVERLARELLGVERQAVRRAVAGEEAIGEHRDVDGALAQRRQTDRERVDAVVEVLAEAAVADELIERPVGRRDQPEVDVDRACCRRAARSGRSSSTRSSLACATSDRSPISSRNSVPSLASSSRPGLRSCAPVNAPFLVAEDFRLEERVGQRRAVDRLEAVACRGG